MATHANPPENCDLCKTMIHGQFIDFRHPMQGWWCNGCPSCFQEAGGKLGTGSGQEYTKQPDGSFLKTGG